MLFRLDFRFRWSDFYLFLRYEELDIAICLALVERLDHRIDYKECYSAGENFSDRHCEPKVIVAEYQGTTGYAAPPSEVLCGKMNKKRKIALNYWQECTLTVEGVDSRIRWKMTERLHISVGTAKKEGNSKVFGRCRRKGRTVCITLLKRKSRS